MKKIFALFAVILFIYSCGTTENANTNTDNNWFTKMATIQGAIFDATTGARLGGEDMEVILIQAATHRSPDAIVTDEEDALVGEYVFTNVPLSLNNIANNEFKMVIIRDGYQRFEGEFALIATVPEDVLGGGGNGDDNNLNNTLDGTYNFIQNIYLFPVGATAPSYNFYVEYDNERVPGATIYLEQDTNNNIETSLTSANMLAATSGLIPVLTATTDDTGLATFAGSSLVLGGRYNVTVLPVVYEGVQLAMNTGEVINFIGMENGGGEDGNITRMIAMADLEPNDQSDGLYIIYASNHDPQDITGIDPDVAGVLTVVFNRPVAMPNANDCTATLIGATDAVLTDPGNPDSVDTDVSDDGYTLILTPHWDTEPDETDVNMDILYAGCTITLMDDDLHNEMLLFGNVDIEYIDTNVPLNATVQITGEQE